MAQVTTLEGLRSQLLTTIFGRRFGLDPNDYAAGAKGFREPVQTASSATTGTSIAFGGSVNLGTATAASSWSLAAPVPGVSMTLFQGSTGGGVVTLASGSFVDTGGSTKTIATFAQQGSYLVLKGLTTALAAVIANEPRQPTSAASTLLAGTVTLS